MRYVVEVVDGGAKGPAYVITENEVPLNGREILERLLASAHLVQPPADPAENCIYALDFVSSASPDDKRSEIRTARGLGDLR